MLNQTFGTEIEMYDITRKHAAELIADHFGVAPSRYVGGVYDTYTAIDRQGRTWKCSRDSSIIARNNDQKCELITPILTYEDMNDLQEVIRILRHAGAKSNADHKCGIHVHIGALDYTVREVRNLINFMSVNQDLIYKAVDTDIRRQDYCKKLSVDMVTKFNANKPKTSEDCEAYWYGTNNRGMIKRHKESHYDSSRYHGLNLHSLFSKGTVEFRLFNGTLHAGLVRSYVVMCLAICHFCKTKTRLAPVKERRFNDKYTMYALLCEIGVKGDEFSNCRDHLTAKLIGGLGHEERYLMS